jgi:hypothetical protein
MALPNNCHPAALALARIEELKAEIAKLRRRTERNEIAIAALKKWKTRIQIGFRKLRAQTESKKRRIL